MCARCGLRGTVDAKRDTMFLFNDRDLHNLVYDHTDLLPSTKKMLRMSSFLTTVGVPFKSVVKELSVACTKTS